MALGISQLRTVARRATTIALDIYDKGPSTLPLFAQTIRMSGQRVVTFEWWEAFPTMIEWIGDRKTQELFGEAIEVEVKPYEVTYKLDRMNVELDGDLSLVTQPQQMGAAVAQAFENGKIERAYAPLRANDLSYDGQNFFDTDHTHPDGSTFDNVVDLSGVGYSRTATGKPTVDEARRELNLAAQRLQVNRLRRSTLVVKPAMPELVVVVKSIDTELAYQALRDEPSYISGNSTLENPWQGKFTLVRDTDPVSGDEKKVDVLLAEAGGPRPSIFVESRGPRGLEFDETSVFSSRIIYFGSDALYGFAPGFPQAAVRIQE